MCIYSQCRKYIVEDLRVRTFLNDTYTAADLEVKIKASKEGRVRLTLSKDGKAVQTLEEEMQQETILHMNVENQNSGVRRHRYFYDLLLEVWNTDGELEEMIPQKVGFRHFEMKDNLMMLNGKRIVFKGVNRHEFSSLTGRHAAREDVVKDIVTMKQNNINAIRTSHYPNDTMVYDLCD